MVVIALAHIKTILDIEVVDDNATSLAEFANVLNGSVGALSASEYHQELYSSEILALLSAKISLRLQQQWSSEIYGMQPRPRTIPDFCSWLNSKVRSEQFRNPFAATSSIQRTDSQLRGRRPQQGGRGGAVFATATPTPVASQPNECPACKEAHSLSWCQTFEEMPSERRMELVREKRLCLCCLKPGHGIKKCLSQNTCRVTGCQSKHNTKLHDAPALFPGRVSDSSNSSEDVIQGFNGHCRTVSSVLLMVVPIKISANGKFVETKALLDSGSQLTLVRQDIVDELGLEGPTQDLRFGTFHGIDPKIPTKKVSFVISSKDNSFSVSVGEAYSVAALNVSPGEVDLLKQQTQWEHLSDLELVPVDPKEVTVLLGMNVRPAHDKFDSRKPKDRSEEPEAVLTPFGWVVVGPTGKKNSTGRRSCFHLSYTEDSTKKAGSTATESELDVKSLASVATSQQAEILTKSQPISPVIPAALLDQRYCPLGEPPPKKMMKMKISKKNCRHRKHLGEKEPRYVTNLSSNSSSSFSDRDCVCRSSSETENEDNEAVEKPVVYMTDEEADVDVGTDSKPSSETSFNSEISAESDADISVHKSDLRTKGSDSKDKKCMGTLSPSRNSSKTKKKKKKKRRNFRESEFNYPTLLDGIRQLAHSTNSVDDIIDAVTSGHSTQKSSKAVVPAMMKEPSSDYSHHHSHNHYQEVGSGSRNGEQSRGGRRKRNEEACWYDDSNIDDIVNRTSCSGFTRTRWKG